MTPVDIHLTAGAIVAWDTASVLFRWNGGLWIAPKRRVERRMTLPKVKRVDDVHHHSDIAGREVQ